MAQHILRNRLINFSSFACQSQQQRNCHRQAYNSLMLKMSQLDRYQQVDQFTQCQKQDCKMVLTNQDKDYIDDWNWVSTNQQLYEDIKDKIDKMKTNKWNFYIWNCRFCGTKNLIQKDKAFFAKNKSKVVVKQALENDKIGKVADNPLTLFVIDSSSSMQQQLYDINQLIKKSIKQQSSSSAATSGKQLSSFVNEKLKKTQIYQKIAQSEKKSLIEVKKKIDPDSKTAAYDDNLTKYKILMSMTQNAVNSICSSGKNGHQSKINIDSSIQRKIGFMFFNSDVILQKIPKKNQTKVIKILNKQYENQKRKDNQVKVDFQNFQELFQAGFSNSSDYGMSMDNFKFSDLDLSNVSPSGQSALGPALVIATGIVSGYGSGSLIVVITDGKANKGIFSEGGLYEEQLNLLKYKLAKARAQTCLMKLQTKNQENKLESQTVLQRYFRKNASSLSVSLYEKQPLDELQRRLKSIIDKSISSKTWTNNIRIKCQNPNIKYNEKQIDKMKKKLFRQSQIQFISPEINESKLNAFDYRHPFMTQVLIEYQNIATKQESKFMAYILQKIIKYNEMNKKQEEELNSVETLQNVMNYLDVQGQKLDLSKIPLSLCKQSFRSYVMQSYKHSMQQQFNKQVMQDMTEFIEKPIFKTPKEYIKSLVKNEEDYQKI